MLELIFAYTAISLFTLVIGYILFHLLFGVKTEKYKSSVSYFRTVAHEYGLPINATLNLTKYSEGHYLILHFKDVDVLIDVYVERDVTKASKSARKYITDIYGDKIKTIEISSKHNLMDELTINIEWKEDT